jgi:pyrimidine-nucleoside phosphorylase
VKLSAPAMRSLIEKKRTGGENTKEEIEALVSAFTRGEIDDAPVAAWLMAVCMAGMSLAETADLTAAMAASGDTIDWGPGALVVDKHSTGGVGDAVTLVAVPLAAAAGVKVAKLSGRALGHTGGTLDKLECIPGLRVDLSVDEFKEQVERIGCAVASATATLAPADKKLYALRDRTATITSVPLIAASILSKKIAGGAAAIVLDVKHGAGAFMQTRAAAEQLGRAMRDVGERLGRRIRIVLTDMDEPLADSVGDALELDEALDALHGEGSPRLREVAHAIASEMLSALDQQCSDPNEVRVSRAIEDRAFAKFSEMVAAQGGRLKAFDRDFKPARTVAAPRAGHVQAIQARSLGELVAAAKAVASVEAARRIGVRLRKRPGDRVERGEPIIDVFEPGARVLDDARIAAAVAIGDRAPDPRPLVSRLA